MALGIMRQGTHLTADFNVHFEIGKLVDYAHNGNVYFWKILTEKAFLSKRLSIFINPRPAVVYPHIRMIP